MKILLFLGTLFYCTLEAQLLSSPIDAMHENFGQEVAVSKKNILLSKKSFQEIQKSAHIKLNTKIYRTFRASDAGKTLGFGILVNRKVRSKNAVVLYIIEDAVLQSIEIIAFNEPLEYIPSQKWQEQFTNIDTNKSLQLNRDIPTITGATLSARSITEGSRIAFGIYNTLLKEK